jgi:CheY-like chemotaxis protein
MEETKYCICCGENVHYNRIERNERIELTCIYCGFLLSVDEPVLSTQDTTPKSERNKFGYVIIADDSKFTRKIIKDLLIEKDLAEEVLDFENGLEATSVFSKLIAEKKPVDAAILDINMPVMDGLTAARIIRSIEAQHHCPHMPIAFFSAVKADDNLRSQMEMLAPANYVNKGTDPDPDKLAERVEQLFTYFIQMKK